MLWFADAQADRLKRRVRGNAGKQLSQFLKRIGLKLVEEWIHDV